LRLAQQLPLALKNMQAESTAAADLLNLLTTEPSISGSEGEIGYAAMDARPW